MDLRRIVRFYELSDDRKTVELDIPGVASENAIVNGV